MATQGRKHDVTTRRLCHFMITSHHNKSLCR